MHVVVTGASSGIGRDLAKVFDGPGNKISIVARRKSLLEELQKEIAVPTAAIDADLADEADPIGWLRRAEQVFGPVDILINNAGISYVEPTHQIDAIRIKAIFQVNTHVPIAATQHVLPSMLERKSGTIVNIASIAAFTYAPYFTHYHATKGALGNFSESLRIELKNSGVRVISVYPGPVSTPMGERNFDQFKDSKKMRRVPTGDTKTLARLVCHAVQKNKPRVIYPRFYRIAWNFPWLARFVTSRTTFDIKGDITPSLPGDLETPKRAG